MQILHGAGKEEEEKGEKEEAEQSHSLNSYSLGSGQQRGGWKPQWASCATRRGVAFESLESHCERRSRLGGYEWQQWQCRDPRRLRSCEQA